MRGILPISIFAALLIAIAAHGGAQTVPNQSLSQPATPAANPVNPAPIAPSATGKAPANTDATLEVAPKIVPLNPPPEEQQPSASEGDNSSGAKPLALTPSAPGRPYLGLSVQSALVRFHKEEIRGLEIVSVDKGGPAERAGLTVPSGMTTVGATGKTAEFFLGPLGELVSPLLAKSGQLGTSGDMIVAIDDQRVTDVEAMNQALAHVAPGETVWFTLMRITREGKVENKKIPIVMGTAAGAAHPASSSLVRNH